MKYEIIHRTVYEYGEAVPLSHHILRMHPRPTRFQTVLSSGISTEPAPAALSRHEDRFGNAIAYLSIEGGHMEFAITSRSAVNVVVPPAIDAAETAPWETIRNLCPSRTGGEWLGAAECIFGSPMIDVHPSYAEYARPSFAENRPVLEAALDLNSRIHADFKFDPAATTVATPVDEVFEKRRGVCQDFAHFQIACLRSLGIPARYVSGYIETSPPPGRPKLAGADASHAWISVFCGDAGWVDLDPTNNILCKSRHITVAWGRDYSDAGPMRGVILGGGCHRVSVAVDVVAME
jgi:transglutaminase-like putative cysteine protease